MSQYVDNIISCHGGVRLCTQDRFSRQMIFEEHNDLGHALSLVEVTYNCTRIEICKNYLLKVTEMSGSNYSSPPSWLRFYSVL